MRYCYLESANSSQSHNVFVFSRYYVTKMNYINYSFSGSGTAAGSASGNASYVHGYKHEGTYEKKVKGQK